MRLPPRLWRFLASKRLRNALIIAPFALMVLAAIAWYAADKWGKAKFEKEFSQIPAPGFVEEDAPYQSKEVTTPENWLPENWIRAFAGYSRKYIGEGIKGETPNYRDKLVHDPELVLEIIKRNMELSQGNLHAVPNIKNLFRAHAHLCSQAIHDGILGQCWTSQDLAKLQACASRLQPQNEGMRCLARQRAKTAHNAREATRQFKASFNWRNWRNGSFSAYTYPTSPPAYYRFKCRLLWLQTRPEGVSLAEVANYLKRLRENDLSCRTNDRPHFTFADFKKFQVMAAHDEPLGSGEYLWELCDNTLDFQTDYDLLQCGIALELYRMKYGAHPEDLTALLPEFLDEIPRDVCDGAPLRYRLHADGSAHVWSLWPSGKDAGGEFSLIHNKVNWTWTTGKATK